MNEKTGKIVRLSYGSALSLMTVITGVLFIWQVLADYFTVNADGFRFDQAGLLARFTRISPAFWIWVVMIIAGFVVWEVFPVTLKRSAYNDPRYTLKRLKKKFPASVSQDMQEGFTYVKKQEKLINILWLCCMAVGLAGIIYTVVYLAIPSHFTVPDNATHEVINAAKNILPWAFVTFAFACGITFYEGVSAKSCLEYARKIAAGNKAVEPARGKFYAIIHHKYFIPAVRICVGCIAVAFIITGAFNGNMTNILDKAVKICSECIGLG